MRSQTWPNHALQNPAIALWLQSSRSVRRAAALGTLNEYEPHCCDVKGSPSRSSSELCCRSLVVRQWLRPRIQRLVILPRQNPLRLEVLELLDSCPQVNGICVLFWSGRMPHSSCKLRLLMRRRQANSTFWLAFVGVTVPRMGKSLPRCRFRTTTSKSRVDVWSAGSRFLSFSHRFKTDDSMITYHARHDDCQPL